MHIYWPLLVTQGPLLSWFRPRAHIDRSKATPASPLPGATPRYSQNCHLSWWQCWPWNLSQAASQDCQDCHHQYSITFHDDLADQEFFLRQPVPPSPLFTLVLAFFGTPLPNLSTEQGLFQIIIMSFDQCQLQWLHYYIIKYWMLLFVLFKWAAFFNHPMESRWCSETKLSFINWILKEPLPHATVPPWHPSLLLFLDLSSPALPPALVALVDLVGLLDLGKTDVLRSVSGEVLTVQ